MTRLHATCQEPQFLSAELSDRSREALRHHGFLSGANLAARIATTCGDDRCNFTAQTVETLLLLLVVTGQDGQLVDACDGRFCSRTDCIVACRKDYIGDGPFQSDEDRESPLGVLDFRCGELAL